MKGSIPETDINAIREIANIAEVISDYVTLQRSGGDSLKGLCPFHEEKTPSFNVKPANGFFHCFGCGKGGDVFTFMQEIEQISFVESVEKLAAKYSYMINYQGGGAKLVQLKGTKSRLIAINNAASEFYISNFNNSQKAKSGQKFLAEKKFEKKDAEYFECGFSADSWSSLTEFLLKKGFDIKELEAAGVSRIGPRGPIDRFRNRLMWPIKNTSDEVIGFGARKIFDDDKMAKYVNTPETLIYKKSNVLFGLNLAKKNIIKQRQVIVVEGYTDVMAMYSAGIKTSVAPCGTAFGEGHLNLIRRMLLDDSFYKTEIIYTFDGDEAGINAALKAFKNDQNFSGQSYVAIMPDGLDPCDVRIKYGDTKLKSLIDERIPLFEFVIKNTLKEYNLDNPEAQLRALEATIPIVAQIKNVSLLDEYARRLAGWVGWLNENEIIQRVRNYVREFSKSNRTIAKKSNVDSSNSKIDNSKINFLKKKDFFLEREILKILIQYNEKTFYLTNQIDDEWFINPIYKKIFNIILNIEFPVDFNVISEVLKENFQENDFETLKVVFTELSTEDIIFSKKDEIKDYLMSNIVSLQIKWVEKEIYINRSKLVRLDFKSDREEYIKLSQDIQDLTNYKAELVLKITGPIV